VEIDERAEKEALKYTSDNKNPENVQGMESEKQL
jgi:hypothetical protein